MRSAEALLGQACHQKYVNLAKTAIHTILSGGVNRDAQGFRNTTCSSALTSPSVSFPFVSLVPLQRLSSSCSSLALGSLLYLALPIRELTLKCGFKSSYFLSSLSEEFRRKQSCQLLSMKTSDNEPCALFTKTLL